MDGTWRRLYSVAARILMVWLYNNTGKSVFAVALFHATLNLSYMLFPVNGSLFDMKLGALVMAFAAVMATVILEPGECTGVLAGLTGPHQIVEGSDGVHHQAARRSGAVDRRPRGVGGRERWCRRCGSPWTAEVPPMSETVALLVPRPKA